MMQRTWRISQLLEILFKLVMGLYLFIQNLHLLSLFFCAFRSSAILNLPDMVSEQLQQLFCSFFEFSLSLLSKGSKQHSDSPPTNLRFSFSLLWVSTLAFKTFIFILFLFVLFDLPPSLTFLIISNNWCLQMSWYPLSTLFCVKLVFKKLSMGVFLLQKKNHASYSYK